VGTNADSLQLRESTDDLINKTQILAREIKSGLEKLNSTITKERRAELIKLTNDFKTWVSKFQDVVRSYGTKKEKTSIPSSYSQSPGNYHGSEPLLFPLQDDKPNRQNEEEFFLQKKQEFVEIENDREFNDQIIRERHKGIKEIETKVVELNDMFRDLSIMVDEQGIEIDNIESHIANAEQYTSQGVQEIASAEKSQRSARTKYCCIALIIVVIIAVVIFVALLGAKII